MGELVGYARCSTVLQDLTAQREILASLGVHSDRVYLDKGLTGTSRARPGLDQALAAVRAGDTLVVPKLDRLARSVPDARDIGDTLLSRGVRLSLGGSVYDPTDPMSKMFFNMLAVFAEFEADLLKMRTREGMAIARSRGKLKGKQPKLTTRQQAELVRMHATGDYTIAELMEVFSVGRATVYRVLERAQPEKHPKGTPSQRSGRQGSACMSIEIRVYLADSGDIGSLGAWLEDVPDVGTTPVPSPSRPGEQGDAWDFLSVLCGTGGAVTLAVNALTTWIESKATHARVKIGEVEVELRGPDPEALERLLDAAGKVAQNGS